MCQMIQANDSRSETSHVTPLLGTTVNRVITDIVAKSQMAT